MRWTTPDPERTIIALGDTHFGVPNMDDTRKNKLLTDLTREEMFTPLAYVNVGDVVNENVVTNLNDPATDAEAVAWHDQLPAPWYPAVGNHDIWNNNRTASQWATAMGLANKNYYVDFDPFRLIVIGPETMPSGVTRIVLTNATLDYLDATLTSTSNPCLIVCHAPLYGTFEPSLGAEYGTTEVGFYIESQTDATDATVRAVLADNANAVAWISGHLHPATSNSITPVTDIVKAETVGSHTLAHILVPSPAYTGLNAEQYDQIISCPITYTEDDVIEVRWRNSSAQCWDAPYEGDPPTVTPRLVHEVDVS